MTTQHSADYGGYTVSVDPDCCQGHNRCVVIAPEVFTTDEFGYSTVKPDAATTLERVQRAAQNCPERAITVTVCENANSGGDAEGNGR